MPQKKQLFQNLSITKLSSASVQPHGSGRPSPKSPSRYAVAAFLEMGTFKALLLAGQGRLSGRVGMRFNPKNILRPITFETASFQKSVSEIVQGLSAGDQRLSKFGCYRF